MIMLSAEGLEKTFTLHLQGGVQIAVLSGVALEVRSGECVALSGPSGAGKSTLMRALYGNYRTNRGRILVRHRGEMIDIAGADPRTVLSVRRETLAYVGQFLHVVPRVRTLDIVAEVGMERGLDPGPARRQACDMLLRLNVPSHLHELPPATFSGGEQQRVNLARGFLGGHRIMLVDEPTASLDAANRDLVVELILESKARGVALVGIFHDKLVCERVADRVFTVEPLSLVA